MPFIVGLSLVALGGLIAWGGISGRLAKMGAAVLPSSQGAKTAADFSPPDTGFQQLSMSGITLGGAGAPSVSNNVPSQGNSNSNSSAPAPYLPQAFIDPATGMPQVPLPTPRLFA